MNISSAAPLRRILVVDDHRIVCEGLTLLLERHPANKVVGTAATGTAAVEAADRMRPDIVTMDLSLPDMNGIDATEHILRKLPLARVIILSASNTSEHVYRAMRAGAFGYVIKDSAATELVEAVARVMAGERYLSPMCAGLDFEGAADAIPAQSPIESLSAREREVLHRVCAGSSSAEIARQLSLSPKTIDTYRGRLMTKLGVGNRTALIRFAIEHSLFPL
jgi:DNA-binding NarL/FixJ family response regulator